MDRNVYWARKTAAKKVQQERATAKAGMRAALFLHLTQGRPVSRKTKPGEGRVEINVFSGLRKRMRAFRRRGTLMGY